MSSANNEHHDEQYARDLQIALDLQDEEARRAASTEESSASSSARTTTAARASNHKTQGGFAHQETFKTPGHMLFVICELEGKAVEMLVDSGASCSAISLPMVHRLGLQAHLNPHVRGQAAGIGAANIVGLLENLVCTMGHVEFRMYFMVLESNDPWLILGLDQLRRFKAVVDLEKNVLVFGGREGVEVPFLDSEIAGEAAEKKILAHAAMPPAMGTIVQSSSSNAIPKKSGLRKLFQK